MDTKNHEKVILNLTTGHFCFQDTRQSKDCVFRITCVGSLIKKLDFQKIFKKDISLISFQQLDLNRHDRWNVRFDSRTKKIVKQRRTLIEFAESLTWNDINSSQNSLKGWPLGGNTVDPKKENRQYPDQLGAKKESDDESTKFIRVMFSTWQWQRKNLLEYKPMNEPSDHIGGNVVQRQSMI